MFLTMTNIHRTGHNEIMSWTLVNGIKLSREHLFLHEIPLPDTMSWRTWLCGTFLTTVGTKIVGIKKSHENNTIYSKKGDQKWTIQRQRKHWEKSKKFLFSIRHLPCYSYSQFSKHFVGDRGKKIYVKEKRTINNWEINIS